MTTPRHEMQGRILRLFFKHRGKSLSLEEIQKHYKTADKYLDGMERLDLIYKGDDDRWRLRE